MILRKSVAALAVELEAAEDVSAMDRRAGSWSISPKRHAGTFGASSEKSQSRQVKPARAGSHVGLATGPVNALKAGLAASMLVARNPFA